MAQTHAIDLLRALLFHPNKNNLKFVFEILDKIFI